MLSISYKKIPARLHFTINNIKLPVKYSSPFLVEWTRGEQNGSTHIQFQLDDCSINFEKRYKCDINLYISKKDEKLREKFVEFKVLRQIGTENKIYGKCRIDITRFYGIDSPKMQTYKLESPRKELSFITLFFKLDILENDFKRSPSGNLTDASLTSISEATALPSEHISEWDISDITTQEQKVEIETFFTNLNNNRTNVPSLATFKKPDKEKVLPLAQTRQRSGSYIERKGKKTRLFDTKKSESNEATSDRLSKFLNARASEPHKESAPKPESTETGRIYLTKPASRNLIRSVLLKEWEKSPLNNTKFSTSAAVIYAALDSTQVLEPSPFTENGFQGFMQLFMELFEQHKFISNASQMDIFIIAISLISLLPLSKNAAPERVKILEELLSKSANEAFRKIVSTEIASFGSITTSLVTDPSNFEFTAKLFISAFKALKSKEMLLKDEVIEAVLRTIDLSIIRNAVESPGRLTFQNGINWSSFVTQVEEEVGASLQLTKEASSTLMMSQQLCSQPSLVKDICPHLPLQLVYKLISEQTPDDFNPLPNEAGSIERLYPTKVHKPIDFEFNIEPVVFSKKIDLSQWNNIKFTPRDIGEFPFLRNNFKISN